jgi:hypothetical protein
VGEAASVAVLVLVAVLVVVAVVVAVATNVGVVRVEESKEKTAGGKIVDPFAFAIIAYFASNLFGTKASAWGRICIQKVEAKTA